MVRNFLLRDDGVFDLLLQKLIAAEQREVAVQRGLRLPALLPVILRQPCGPEHGAHAQQLHGIEKAALLRPLQRGGDIPQAGKGRAALQADEPGRILRFLLELFAELQGKDGPKLPAKLLGRLCGSLLGQQLQDLGQLDGLIGSFL